VALRFGLEEKLSCLVDVPMRGPANEALCLGYKTSIRWFGGGVYHSDDGYVVTDREARSMYWPLPEGEELAALQADGSLPNPLPEYAPPVADVVFGYSLWWSIGIAIVIGVLRSRRTRSRLEREEREPPGMGPPELRTPLDTWLAEQLASELGAGERIWHQAYVLSPGPGVGAKAWFLALTDRRLIGIETKQGAFGPLERRGEGKLEIPRDRVVDAAISHDDDRIGLALDDGSTISFWVHPSDKKLSNQTAFRRDVWRHLRRAELDVPAPIAQ
jgi:hypothetical protein